MNRAIMNWTFLDMPPRDISAERLKTANQADQCVKWLKVQGFEITLVQRSPRKPRIHIKCSPLCAKLEGAVWMFERTKQGERRYWVALRFGCEVRWIDAGPEQSRSVGAQ